MPVRTPERWLPLPGWEGHYLVSSEGNVYSLARRQADGRIRGGMMLTPVLDSNGYLRVTLSRDGHSETRMVHDLVAGTFIGPKPPGRQVRHLTGDQRVNRSSKLRYGTQAQNERDKRPRRGRPGQRKGENRSIRCNRSGRFPGHLG